MHTGHNTWVINPQTKFVPLDAALIAWDLNPEDFKGSSKLGQYKNRKKVS